MRATDVVGWTLDGAAYCARHRPERPDAQPVFACDEGAAELVCDVPHDTDPLTFETLLES